MLGKSHALCGLIAGVGMCSAVPSAPLPVKGLVVVTAGGASLLNDLDHPSATAARSLGIVTKLIAHGVDRASLAIYHASRLPADPVERKSGHRLWTHTVPSCLLAGLLVGLLVLVSPVACAVACGLLAGLLAQGVKVAGGLLGLVTFVVTWWTVTQYPGWSWLVPLAVTVGCLVHIAGDWVTNSGVPALWPLESRGRRWRLVTCPVTFAAGDSVETMFVRPGLVVCLVLVTGWETGLLGLVVTAFRGGAA